MDDDGDDGIDQFGAVVGQQYGLAEAQMGRELYEANVTNSVGVTEYWKAKATFWNALAGVIVLLALLGSAATITALVKWWMS